MIELPAFGISQPSAPRLNWGFVFEAIEQAASGALVGFLETVGDQPITHRPLIPATACGRVESAHDLGATSLQRLRNQQPGVPPAALTSHHPLTRPHYFANQRSCGVAARSLY